MTEEASPMLKAFLSERDCPCPQCEYNLRNLQGTRCPECGEELILRVNVAEPRQKLLITGLIGLSAGCGLNGLLLIYAVIQVILSHDTGEPEFWFIIGAGFAVEGAALIAWLREWRWMRRRPATSRLRWALGCWLLTLIDLLIFSFNIR
jgi:hypothetical protein